MTSQLWLHCLQRTVIKYYGRNCRRLVHISELQFPIRNSNDLFTLGAQAIFVITTCGFVQKKELNNVTKREAAVPIITQAHGPQGGKTAKEKISHIDDWADRLRNPTDFHTNRASKFRPEIQISPPETCRSGIVVAVYVRHKRFMTASEYMYICINVNCRHDYKYLWVRMCISICECI